MKYLEIIKEYEKHNETMKKNGFVIRPENNMSFFLLKAFKAMREIANEIFENLVEGDNLQFDDVDKEFERRMKNEETKRIY